MNQSETTSTRPTGIKHTAIGKQTRSIHLLPMETVMIKHEKLGDFDTAPPDDPLVKKITLSGRNADERGRFNLHLTSVQHTTTTPL